MRKLHISNEEGLNTVVKYKSTKPPVPPKLGINGKKAQYRRYLSATDSGLHDALTEKYGENYAQELIDNDPDVDVEAIGQFINDSQAVFLGSDSKVMYCPPKIIEVIFGPDGSEKERRDPKDVPANVNEEDPLMWSKMRMSRTKAVTKLVFTRSLQLMHTDGLSYEYLYKMAKDLDENDEMAMIGSGPKGRKPLIFNTNGSPYRAFLEGRVKGKEYMLFLHLSNMELKLPGEEK